MNDETRKALDKIFATGDDGRIKPLGASGFKVVSGAVLFNGMFKVPGTTLNHLRQLYNDAIAADDAAKLDAQREAEANAENDKNDKQDKGDE
jgi:hypothetical protein